MLTESSPVSRHGQTVCVTGAGGFIASWLVKLLLEKGYNVRGTVRDPEDPKNYHLKALEGAADRLTLVKADLLDYSSLRSTISTCNGVFHTACPTTDNPDIVTKPAVMGTKNVFRAVAEVGGIGRVVYTSTIGAIYMDPNRDPNAIVDESYWTDLDYCKATKNWYCYAKTVAEKEAMKAAADLGIDLVVVNPSVVLGPLLHSTVNWSIAHIMQYLTGSAKTYTNAVQAYVDVRDVAVAHIAVYEQPEAEGRYLCAESLLHRGDLIAILKELFPQYPVPTKCSDEINPPKKGYKFTTQKIQKLGIQFRPVKQCIYDTVKSLQDKGLLLLHEHQSQPFSKL